MRPDGWAFAVSRCHWIVPVGLDPTLAGRTRLPPGPRGAIGEALHGGARDQGRAQIVRRDACTRRDVALARRGRVARFTGTKRRGQDHAYSRDRRTRAARPGQRVALRTPTRAGAPTSRPGRRAA